MELKKEIDLLQSSVDLISEDRKKILQNLAKEIQLIQQEKVNLVFVCTHNSRRSHLAQIWWQIAVEEFNLSHLQTFSAGTEATRIHQNTLKALINQGFSVEEKYLNESLSEENPKVDLNYLATKRLTCFSKTINDKSLPEKFIAVMTCDHADENCPFIPNALKRFSLTYEDPKSSDGTPEMQATYLERSRQIGREALYALSLLK